MVRLVGIAPAGGQHPSARRRPNTVAMTLAIEPIGLHDGKHYLTGSVLGYT